MALGVLKSKGIELLLRLIAVVVSWFGILKIVAVFDGFETVILRAPVENAKFLTGRLRNILKLDSNNSKMDARGASFRESLIC